MTERRDSLRDDREPILALVRDQDAKVLRLLVPQFLLRDRVGRPPSGIANVAEALHWSGNAESRLQFVP
jgi:hypothetical protein